jgi:7-cyano-7-deazaguanine reductase
VLFAVARASAREPLGLASDPPFHGQDIWNAWELTWLDTSGKPVVATATFSVDAASPNIIESKSLKLYLNSFAMSHQDSQTALEKVIATDLSAVAGANVEVSISTGAGGAMARMSELPGTCVDDLELKSSAEYVNPELLRCFPDDLVTAVMHSHLLRSLCPVTGQPDFGSVLVRYHGPRIDPVSFLEYVVSFRQHQDFHETCVERMFADIRKHCAPDKLTVYARYTRRGGLDINPFRSDFETEVENLRLWRQ